MHLYFLGLVSFICGFAAISGSIQACEREILEGTDCKLKNPKENLNEIRWQHVSSQKLIFWKNKEIRENTLEESIGEDGSLVFKGISVEKSGEYEYSYFDNDGIKKSGLISIKVYAKVPKPTLFVNCYKDGGTILTCNTGNRTNLTISWTKDGASLLVNVSVLYLKADQVQEYKSFRCTASNPVSKNESASIVPCKVMLLGYDFEIMVAILAGGGTLLLLFICFLLICTCQCCGRRKKHLLDEQELRLQNLQLSTNTGTSQTKNTARGQPAPPIPELDQLQVNPSPQMKPRTLAPSKPQIRSRPPPPPEDEEKEDLPPLPHPRNKQHRKNNQKPYRPME